MIRLIPFEQPGPRNADTGTVADLVVDPDAIVACEERIVYPCWQDDDGNWTTPVAVPVCLITLATGRELIVCDPGRVDPKTGLTTRIKALREDS